VSLRGGGPIEELAVPSGTTVEEHDLVTDGDVLVGSQSTVEFGLRGRNVALGERVSVENDIEAEGDCRLDTWCSVDGNVLVGEDAYLGERVTVTGRLMVSGDLDIGDDVTIEEGFEANGWIVIRNPVPTLVFYFIVLSQLLRLGETDAADNLAEALADGEDVRDPCWSRVAPRFPTTRGAFRRPRASATTVGSTATSARSRSASASATRCSAPCAPERGSQSARTRRSTATSLLAAEPSRSKPAPACSATSPPAISSFTTAPRSTAPSALAAR